jgi:hypothetical protein
MGKYTRTGKQLAEAKAKRKEKRASNLDRETSSQIPRESLRESQFPKKNRSAYASAVFYEKVLGYRQ